jgi:uncharacterized membrane protein
MTEQDQWFHVLLAVFDREYEATQAMDQLRQMARDRIIELQDAATMRRDPEGKVHVKDIGDPTGARCSAAGAIAGGVVGLIFPPSNLAGATVDAAAGGIYGHFRDKGFSNQDLEKAGEELRPGQSALIAVARDRFVDEISRGVRGYTKLDEYLLDVETGTVVVV